MLCGCILLRLKSMWMLVYWNQIKQNRRSSARVKILRWKYVKCGWKGIFELSLVVKIVQKSMKFECRGFWYKECKTVLVKVGFICINAFLCWILFVLCIIEKESEIRNQQSMCVSQKNMFELVWKLISKNWKIGSEWIWRRCEFHSRIMTVSNRDSSGFWKYKFKSPNKSGGYSGEQVRW